MSAISENTINSKIIGNIPEFNEEGWSTAEQTKHRDISIDREHESHHTNLKHIVGDLSSINIENGLIFDAVVEYSLPL
jgi:hydrogenase maturation factor HypE